MTKEQNPDLARLLDFSSVNVIKEGLFSSPESQAIAHLVVY